MDPLEYTPYGFDLARLFRRACVECPPAPLKCPDCPSGEVCIQISPSCTQCASRKCVPEGASGAANNGMTPPSSGPNIGGIVGGVIGGIAIIAIITFLVWWFVIRKRRQQWEADYVADFDEVSERRKQSGAYMPVTSRTPRSDATRSIASTTFTRSSNVIPIAFFPGVTASDNDNYTNYTPPVPPIPSSQPDSPRSPYSEGTDRFFMPGDLRDSTYSGFTSDGASTIDRRSVATRSIAGRSIAPSIAPSLLRESIASHFFQDDALANPMPAQTAQRAGKANVVSVSRTGTPAMNAGSARFPVNPTRSNMTPTIVEAASSGTDLRPRPHVAMQTQSRPATTLIPDIHVTSDDASDFADAVSVQSSSTEVRAAIAQAARRASAQPTHGGLGSMPARPVSNAATRGMSPFSDENRISDSSSSSANSTPQL